MGFKYTKGRSRTETRDEGVSNTHHRTISIHPDPFRFVRKRIACKDLTSNGAEVFDQAHWRKYFCSVIIEGLLV